MNHWALTLAMLAAAMSLFFVGKLIRLYAYHAGQGFGLGKVNAPVCFRWIPWPMAWIGGLLASCIGYLLVVVVVGADRWLLWIVLAIVLDGIGRVVAKLCFGHLFRTAILRAYDSLDRIERTRQEAQDEVVKREAEKQVQSQMKS